MKHIFKICKGYDDKLAIEKLEIANETEKTYVTGGSYPERILKSRINIVSSRFNYEVYAFEVKKGICVIRERVNNEIRQNELQNIRLRKFVEILDKEG